MKQIIPAIIAVAMLAACSSDRNERITVIEQMEKEAFGDGSNFDATKALSLINNYAKFADEFPEDAEAPKYLFKAGDFSMGLEKSEQAIAYFDRVINEYPDFEKVPYCLFLKAFICENQMADIDRAKILYTEFLEKYPDHDMAESARFSIRHLGKSPEELIREFEQKPDSAEAI